MKQELLKFLLAYRSTPQVTTGQSPAKLMFGRELKTKLPEMRCERSIMNKEVCDRDWQKKLSEKQYADAHRGAKPAQVKSGDEVLIRNENKNKLAPNFELEPAVVKRKEGNEIVVEIQDGVEKRRSSSFVKPYNQSVSAENTQERVSVEYLKAKARVDRPTRNKKLPAKFDDFVVKI